MAIEQFALSTLSFTDVDEAYQLASILNLYNTTETPIGVEVYMTRFVKPPNIKNLEYTYGVGTTSVHIEVPFSAAEAWHQIRYGDFHLERFSRLKHVAVYGMTGTADRLRGVRLAEELDVTKNVHINTFFGFILADSLPILTANKGITVEQSYKHNFNEFNNVPAGITGSNPEILYDPRVIAQMMDSGVWENLGVQRLRVGIDHLYTQLQRQGVTPQEVLRDPVVRRHTAAFNLAGAFGARLDFEDPQVQQVFQLIGEAQFGDGSEKTLGVFTFTPTLLRGKSRGEKVDFFRNNINRIVKFSQNRDSNSALLQAA